MLSLHYRVKCRSCSLAIDNNEFLPVSICLGSEIINWIATNVIDNYYYSRSHTCHITSSSFYHVLKMSSCSTNVSDRRWHHLLTARSVTAWLQRPTRHWCIISVCRLTILKIKTKQQIFNDFVVSVIFWADACTTQFEFIVVNGQTTTSAFHKVVSRQP